MKCPAHHSLLAHLRPNHSLKGFFISNYLSNSSNFCKTHCFSILLNICKNTQLAQHVSTFSLVDTKLNNCNDLLLFVIIQWSFSINRDQLSLNHSTAQPVAHTQHPILGFQIQLSVFQFICYFVVYN